MGDTQVRSWVDANKGHKPPPLLLLGTGLLCLTLAVLKLTL